MSKRVRNLLVIGIFILSMAVVLLVLMLTQPKDEVEEETTTSAKISVLSYDRDSVANLTIKNETGEFSIRNGIQGFVIDEYSDLRQNSTIMGAAARCAATINAEALVEENAQDLDKYGLAEDAPKASCDVTLKDGTEYTVYFGIDAPDGDSRYVRLKDSGDVYTVLTNSSGYFYYDESDFLSLAVTDEITNNNVAPTIDRLEITRKDLDYDVIFIDDSKKYSIDDVTMASAQVMISPVYAYLDITNSTAVVYGLWGLTAEDVVKVHPTEEDFEKYGLDDPFCTVNLDAELRNYHLDIGDVASYALDQNGEPTSEPISYYAYYRGIDVIYTFGISEIPFVNFQVIDILSTMMTSNYIYDLDGINIKFLDEPAEYIFDLEPNKEETYLTGTLNGEGFEEYDFKILYQFLLKCPIDDLCFDEPPENSTVATIEINRTDGKSDILEFYDIGNNRVSVRHNGIMSFSQPRGYLNVLHKNLEAFANGATADELQEVW